MTISLKHTTQSTKPASARANDIDGPIWNEEHTLTMATGNLLGRTTAGDGVVEELSASEVRTFLSSGAQQIFDTKADLEAANVAADADSVYVSGYTTAGDGGGALYKRVGSEPSHSGKIQSNDGAWWEIAGAELNVRSFGAVGDGSTDDRASIQSAIDAAESMGGGVVLIPHTDTYYRIRLALHARSGVTVHVPNNATRIVCTADGTNARWPSYGCWNMGGFQGDEYMRCTAYAISNVSVGQETVTTSTAANAGNFAVGDVVAVETASQFTIGTYDLPTWLQMNVVTSVDASTGVIGLRRPIDQTQTSVQIRQLNSALTFRNSDLSDSGRPLSAIRDFALIGGTWENADSQGAAPFCGDGGAIDCAIKPHKIVAATGAAYGNLWAHTVFECDTQINYSAGCELAFLSHNNYARIGSITFDASNTVSNPGRGAGINEASRNNVLKIGSIDFADSTPNGEMIQLINTQDCFIEVGSLTGDTTTHPAVFIRYSAYTGTNVPCRDNKVAVGASKAVSQQRYVQISGGSNCYRNSVDGHFRGTVTADAMSITAEDNVIDGWYENGAISIDGTALRNKFTGRIGTGKAHNSNYTYLFTNKWNTSTAAQETLKALSYIAESATYTSASALSKTVTFPAGTLQAGDVLKFRMRGSASGATDTKDITISFAGTTVLSLSLATGVQQFDIDIEMFINSNTVFVGQCTRVVNSAVVASDATAGSKNFSTTSYDFVVSGVVNGAGDSLVPRFTRLYCLRPEVDGVYF